MNDIEQLELDNWLMSGDYLPSMLRDFHDQKDLFKSMHHLYQDSEFADRAPNWVDGQIYTMDWFLFFMASRGYTLQKSRKKIAFKDMPDYRKILEAEAIFNEANQ